MLAIPEEGCRHASAKTFDYLGRMAQTLRDPFLQDDPIDGVFELNSYDIMSEMAFVVSLRKMSLTRRTSSSTSFSGPASSNSNILGNWATFLASFRVCTEPSVNTLSGLLLLLP